MSNEDRKIRRRLNTKRWRENNPEKAKEYQKLYEQRDKTKIYRKKYREINGNVNAKKWRDNNQNKAKNSYYRYQYGITLEQYNQMFVDQNGVCAICGNMQKDGRSLCVDHSHMDNHVRGLLCLDCNSGIGHLKDDINLLLKGIEYLNKTKFINNSNE